VSIFYTPNRQLQISEKITPNAAGFSEKITPNIGKNYTKYRKKLHQISEKLTPNAAIFRKNLHQMPEKLTPNAGKNYAK